MTIKLLVPDMPSPAELLPYLEEIHANRWYSNQGPLALRLEARLEEITKIATHVVSTGTSALELLLRAVGVGRGSRVLVPAMTFVATGQAIVNAGGMPMLNDVDGDSFLLDPGGLDPGHIRALGVTVVVPVASFGAPVDVDGWEEFAEETGVQVIVDGAGAILDQPTSRSQRVHFAWSMHATKFAGCGEGGAISTYNSAVMGMCRSMSSFGLGGGNHKMSEYHAAVGLAAFSQAKLTAKKVNADQLVAQYRLALPADFGAQSADIGHRAILPVVSKRLFASDVMSKLDARGIQTKQWYRPFLHETGVLADYMVSGDLNVTGYLRRRMVGLPFHQSMTLGEVDMVCAALSEISQ